MLDVGVSCRDESTNISEHESIEESLQLSIVGGSESVLLLIIPLID